MIPASLMCAGKLLIKPIVTQAKFAPYFFHIIVEFGEDFEEVCSDFTEENANNHIKFVQLGFFSSVIQQFVYNDGNEQYFDKYKGNVSHHKNENVVGISEDQIMAKIKKCRQRD
jgi:hypothetical protein